MSELKVWEFVLQELEREGQVGLMVVVQSEGSSPGRQGFKMAVANDGSMTGSIGGGIMEHKLVEYIRSKLSNQESFHEFRKQVHSKDAPRDQSGMICYRGQMDFVHHHPGRDPRTPNFFENSFFPTT